MNNTFRTIMCALFLSTAFGVSLFFAGCDGATLKVYQENSITEIARGNTLDISVESKGIKEGDNIILKVEGSATIDQDGKLTANTDAQVGSEIKVWAEAGKTKSNVLKITVVDLVPSSVRLNAVSDKIKVGSGGHINLSVAIDPTYATIKDYNVSITKINGAEPNDDNANWASIDGDDFVLGDDAPVGTVFELTASIVGHSEVKGTTTITVVETTPMDDITASDITINTASEPNKTADITAYYLNRTVDTTLDMFTYTSLNEEIATVDAQGNITPKAHGVATINVGAVGTEATTSFKIYVIVPPTSIELTNVSQNIIKTGQMSFGKSEALTLSVQGINTTYTCSDEYTYTFEMLDGSGNPTQTASDDIATVGANDAITFKQTGKVRVTIKSNSTLNNVTTTEATKVIVVNVNDGQNIRTVNDLKTYASQNTNSTANISGNIYLTSDANFGKYDDGQYKSVDFYGDRLIYGNGYTISTERLPLATTDKGGSDFLKFSPINNSTAFIVQVYDLSVIGCGGVGGVYTGELTDDAGKAVVSATGSYMNTYRRGIRINASDYDKVKDLQTKAYAKDLMFSNVTVSGFDVGIRVDHAVDGVMTDINIANCFSNGLEFSQNTMTLNNVEFGQLGAFGIEMTPDDVKDKATTNPSGTAGANYDETPSLKLTGTIKSENYNNGGTTLYMKGLSSQLGMSIPSLMDAIVLAGINEVTKNISDESVKANAQNQLVTVLNSCLKKERTVNDTKESVVNFYLLIFINKEKITNYDKGNMESKFATYTSNGEANLINASEILMNLASNPEYTDYKKYQYISLDLQTGTALGNVGQVVVVNQAYDANYATQA